MKTAFKLQEFVAHSSKVNCLKIGRRTSRVLVTGGEDHKVNMWAIGKPNSILSLSGHSSPVSSVTFDAAESHVVAGATNGAIKLWDLEEAKVVRSLAGHRSNCVSVDFHPFGEFFASGSDDTSLKLWDLRRKTSIHTFKGHVGGVKCLRFSPDGRWIVSGGEDSIVKLWDLAAGKLIHDFKCHKGHILSMDFHPHEFLLATGSEDKTTKFHDLETFDLIGSSGPQTCGAQALKFTPDGRALISALEDSFKVYTWEPLRCQEEVSVNWSQPADLNVRDGKLLGCSFNDNCVAVWVVDLSRVAPFKSNPKDPKSSNERPKDPPPHKAEPEAAARHETRQEPRTDSTQRQGPNLETPPVRAVLKLSSLKKISEENPRPELRPQTIELRCEERKPSTKDPEEKPASQERSGRKPAEMVDALAAVPHKKARLKASIEDGQVIDEILMQQSKMTTTLQSRLAKLQAVRKFWMKKDLKSAVETLSKVADKAVLADALSVFVERSDVFNLEIASMILPLVNGLINSDVQRHVLVGLNFTRMLVKCFGQVIRDAFAAVPAAGVDLQAEKRFERCSACLEHFKDTKQHLKQHMRKSGEIGKAAQDLNSLVRKTIHSTTKAIER